MLNKPLTAASLAIVMAALTACGSDDTPSQSAVAGVSESNNEGDADSPLGSDSMQDPSEPAANPSGDGPVAIVEPDLPNDAGNGSSTDTPAPAPVVASYELTFINLTAGQPLSPPIALAHAPGYRLFTVGKPSSVALEALAEGASTTELVSAATASGIVWSTAVSPNGPIGPGHQANMTLDIHDNADLSNLFVSAAAMLVNTNDAITALRSRALHQLGVGQSWTVDLGSYDTGTEANTETAGTIPGPAGAGEGFNPARDDVINAVLGHPGAITADDGLAGSALGSIHRWNNPVARLRVRRTR